MFQAIFFACFPLRPQQTQFNANKNKQNERKTFISK